MPRDVEFGQWRTARGTLLLLANPSRTQRTIQLRTQSPIVEIERLDGVEWKPVSGTRGTELQVDMTGPGGSVLLIRTAP